MNDNMKQLYKYKNVVLSFCHLIMHSLIIIELVATNPKITTTVTARFSQTVHRWQHCPRFKTEN